MAVVAFKNMALKEHGPFSGKYTKAFELVGIQGMKHGFGDSCLGRKLGPTY